MNTVASASSRPLSKRMGYGFLSIVTGIIPVIISLYTIALTTSMSGMEFFAWITTLFTLIAIIVDKTSKTRQFRFHTTGIELPLFGFIIVVALGLKLNAPQADFMFNFGSIRNLLLIYFFAYAFQLSGKLNQFFATLVTTATLVAIYGIWQHFTGLDLWRGSNSPIEVSPVGDHSTFSTIGFFGHKLTFAHVFAMIIPIPWAAFILNERRNVGASLLYLFVTLILITSVIFTYSRGVWIALLATLPLMAFLVSRKLFVIVALVLGITAGLVYKNNPDIAERAASVSDTKYFSNSERKDLWAINMEMFYDYPWIGIGYKQNEELAVPYFKKLGIENGMAGHAHSNYLQMLATTGLIGTACYMLMILAMALMSLRLFSSIPSTHYWHKVFALAGIGAQLAFHIGGVTQWSFGDAEVNHMLMFWFAVIVYMNERYSTGIVLDDRSL